MKSRYRAVSALASLLLLIPVAGCGSSRGGIDVQQDTEVSNLPAQTVKVRRGDITPTLSAKSVVTPESTYIITMPKRGAFESKVKQGTPVAAGSVLGSVDGAEILAPSAGIVKQVLSDSADLPASYPIFEMSYQGFATAVDASRLVRNAGGSTITGKFQISDGVGPSDCVSVVTTGFFPSSFAMSNESQEDGSQYNHQSTDEASHLLCLIGKDIPVQAGQQALVVLTTQQRKDVLLLPVSAVAGRNGKGKVSKTGDTTQLVEVQIGISDGANIEIISGLNEGDVVLASSPNLDPRGQ